MPKIDKRIKKYFLKDGSIRYGFRSYLGRKTLFSNSNSKVFKASVASLEVLKPFLLTRTSLPVNSSVPR